MFRKLFLQGTPAEVEAQVRELDTGRSILDAVAGQAKDLQRDRRRARPRPARPVLHQRPRPGAAAGRGRASGTTSPSRWSTAQPPDRPGQPARVHGQGAAHVRPGPAGLRDRLDPLDHAHARQRELAGHRDRRRDDHRRLPQPLAPRQVGREAGAAEGHRRVAHEAARRPVRRAEGRRRGRRDAARPHDGPLRLQPRQRQHARRRRTCRRSSPAAASGTASTWPSTASATTRCRTCSSRCSSGWGSRPTGSPPAPAPCGAWRVSHQGRPSMRPPTSLTRRQYRTPP